ncbi:TPA: PcfJ domain-containing protein [Pseudomonas aeruginosa]|nr:PcfJ domain-containing protein [Pseudomonas aeruginosa]HDQ4723259.1 PcfJ domain-containing protein [Pseudomonas aeruginosa]
MAKVYRQAKDLIITHKLFRLARYAELEGVRQLTISNLWRIERLADGAIRSLEHDLVRDEWVEVDTLEHWPEVPFYPIRETRALNWWREIARQVVWKALMAAGYSELPQYCREVTDWVEVEGALFPVPAPGQAEMSSGRMAYCLIERYIGRRVPVKGKAGKYRWKDGLLESKSMMAGARALRAAFFEHIFDGEVLSAMRAIDYRDCSFIRYLNYARWRPGLLKVAQEHRNLLPLLRCINPAQWGRDDLFSRKLWVRGGRKYTALDRRPIGLAHGRGIEGNGWRMRSFEDGAAWRWLRRASSVVLKEWWGGQAIITHLAQARVSVQVPMCAYVYVLRAAERRQTDVERCAARYPVQLQQLLRVYLIHCAKLWRDKGHAQVRAWLRSDAGNVSNMLDYLVHEGFQDGQPQRNATWAALLRRSEDWHKRIALEGMVRDGPLLVWESLLGETVIDGVVFTPLNSSRALAIEGYEMGHCVATYDDYCHEGKYQVYAVRDPDGRRSTLGFWIHAQDHIIRDQHEGGRHGNVSAAALRAGERLERAYDVALAVRRESDQAVAEV